MPYAVPNLPYSADALEPHLDAETMRLHHGKHHQAYVDKLNAAVDGTSLDDTPVEQLIANLSDVPEDRRDAVRNQGGGHLNHSLFWQSMSPDGGGAPDERLASAIEASFGDFETFKSRFELAGAGQFGSGWVWLALDGAELVITTTANQDNPISAGLTPLLGNDVWEHAYYLTYRNRRPEYLKAWWNVVDWRTVGERHLAARAS